MPWLWGEVITHDVKTKKNEVDKNIRNNSKNNHQLKIVQKY